MNKTDFAELKERLTKLDDELAIKKQFEKEVTEYRYAVYPDADKDQIQTMLADCGCHGYFDAAFIGVKHQNTKSATIISELIEIIEDMHKELDEIRRISTCGDETTTELDCNYIATDSIDQTTTRLQKLRDGR